MKSKQEDPKDFNNIREWLVPLLEGKKLSIERFARQVGVSKAVVYFYLSDTSRPTEETMKRMCDVLQVPFEEGLRQYTPKKNGRPKGS